MELSTLIDELLPAARDEAAKKGIHLSCETTGASGLINGDSMRISQVIWNLLSNAIKFTPKEGRIDLKLSKVEQWVEFSVQDTGMGIAPQFLPHMFERFHQQDSNITKNFGGLGLGLAIVRHIVELHGGSVHAASQGIGMGATFTVKFPSIPN
jgi:signal transduction histidine kinase